ncbi:MAG: GTP-binding protein [Legionellales bacterium]|nr:GTP-binding protein [Legionellales bacterium]
MFSQLHENPRKICLVGDSEVGKTSLLNRLIDNSCSIRHNSATIGGDLKHYPFRLNEKTYAVNLWDTAGQERFALLLPTYFRQANAIIIVVSLNKHCANKDYLQKYLDDQLARQFRTLNNARISQEIDIFLLINKSDLCPNLKRENCNLDYLYQEIAANLTNPFHENHIFLVSAETNSGLDAAFKQIFTVVCQKELTPPQQSKTKIEFSQESANVSASPPKHRCCK